MLIEKVSDKKQIEIIASLANEIWHEYFIPIIGKAQVVYMLEKFQSKKAISEQIKKGFLYYLIKNNHVPIGYIGALPKGNQLFLSKLYFISSERSKGHGRKALEFLEKLALKKGASKIILTVNKNNLDTIKAYKKLGFANTGSIVQDIGHDFWMDDYKMEKVV